MKRNRRGALRGHWQDAAMGIEYEWCGSFTNVEANSLHAEAGLISLQG
jgi:hypothetical protein